MLPPIKVLLPEWKSQKTEFINFFKLPPILILDALLSSPVSKILIMQVILIKLSENIIQINILS